jgi:hypothetical protein
MMTSRLLDFDQEKIILLQQRGQNNNQVLTRSEDI